ncbi:MAG: hypothetical protein H6557_12230 [Lewinellaceae bacterium]|nr:hypothetical protein [Phaeodactylibacter sp.]MCB9037376.1 hypothetical protein [Lewinellaceae bacterium]
MNIPSDLKIEIVTGGLLPSINRSLIINAEGFCEYSKTEAGKIGKPPLEKKQFTLLESDLETIWKAVIGNDFFNLQETYINEEIKDGLFLIVFIQGDEKKHQVTIENEKVDAINSIISVIESLTPIKEKFIILLNKPGRSE